MHMRNAHDRDAHHICILRRCDVDTAPHQPSAAISAMNRAYSSSADTLAFLAGRALSPSAAPLAPRTTPVDAGRVGPGALAAAPTALATNDAARRGPGADVSNRRGPGADGATPSVDRRGPGADDVVARAGVAPLVPAGAGPEGAGCFLGAAPNTVPVPALAMARASTARRRAATAAASRLAAAAVFLRRRVAGTIARSAAVGTNGSAGLGLGGEGARTGSRGGGASSAA